MNDATYVIRKGEFYWIAISNGWWAMTADKATRYTEDEARSLLKALTAQFPGQTPEFDPKMIRYPP